jgi:hypothetical protein
MLDMVAVERQQKRSNLRVRRVHLRSPVTALYRRRRSPIATSDRAESDSTLLHTGDVEDRTTLRRRTMLDRRSKLRSFDDVLDEVEGKAGVGLAPVRRNRIRRVTSDGSERSCPSLRRVDAFLHAPDGVRVSDSPSGTHPSKLDTEGTSVVRAGGGRSAEELGREGDVFHLRRTNDVARCRGAASIQANNERPHRVGSRTPASHTFLCSKSLVRTRQVHLDSEVELGTRFERRTGSGTGSGLED